MPDAGNNRHQIDAFCCYSIGNRVQCALFSITRLADFETDSSMLILPGAPALSEFRTQKLLSTLQAAQPGISAVYAEYVHFADF